MKEFKTEEICNLAILGHSGSGKTTLSDGMLFSAGEINRIGSIQDGSTVSDYLGDEAARQISLRNALLHLQWQGKKINIIDAPGYMDFVGDAKSAAQIADINLLAISAAAGIEVGTEFAWGYSEEFNKASVVAITMLDKEHTHFDEIIENARNSFSNAITAVSFPVNAGPAFNSIVDIIRRKLIVYDTNGQAEVKDIPDNLVGKTDELYEQLLERIAESNDELLEKFFDEGTLSDEDVLNGMKHAILTRKLIPVLALSTNNKSGLDLLLNLLASYAPNPADMQGMIGAVPGSHEKIEKKVDPTAPVSLFIFKTVHEQHVGDISFFKLQTGILKSGTDLKNTAKNDNERVGTIFLLNGKTRSEINSLAAGDIGALVKLKSSHTCNTLCDPKAPFVYEPIKYPDPIIRSAIELKAKGDEDKIGTGLNQVHQEDPTFHYVMDPELKQTIISGQGEIHLEVALKKIKDQFNIEVDMIEPKVPYRETIRKTANARYRHKKQSGGAGQFGEVELRIEPLTRGGGLEFASELVGQNVDRAFVPSVEKGFRQACQAGPLSGNMVIDIKAAFIDGKQHPVDSKDIAFQIAGRGAFQEAFLKSDPILLEPIYELEIKIPEEYMGDVMGDISSRRGKVTGMDSEGRFQIIRAEVPLANLYKYSTILRSITQGRGFHRRKFAYYEYVPRDVQEKIVEEYRKQREEGN
ncbi:MAG TPA: elongation factor G [Candidatus Marinimicrobia bacterium]|nr:elongation factor G [Candidatus Neomarinimicrobiota bacterium]